MPPRDGHWAKYTLFPQTNASETFLDERLGGRTFFASIHLRTQPRHPTDVRCTNESFVKPRENPSIHPSVIPRRVRGLRESIPARIEHNLNVHLFGNLDFFVLFYTTNVWGWWIKQ